jgi:cytochrome c2
MIFRQFALLLAALIAVCPDAFGQDAAAKSVAADGQLTFNNVCRTCHTLKEGDNRLGPNLHKHHRPQGGISSRLQLFKCDEGCRSDVGYGHA